MQIAPEREVAILLEKPLCRSARVRVRRIAETLEIALEQHADLCEIFGEIGIILYRAHALGMRENDRQAERLKPLHVGREEVRQLLGPEIDEAELVLHRVRDDFLGDRAKDLRLDVDLAAGNELQRNLVRVEFLL